MSEDIGTEIFPEYDADGQEIIFYPNIWRNIEAQLVTGLDCFNPVANLNPTDNLITLKLTEAEFVKMYSALYFGAEFAYPDEFMQIMVNFLKGLHCPPDLVADECKEYPTYANNIAYSPVNPFISPDEIPDGYLTQPFLVNGQNGNDFPNFDALDVLVPFDAITFDIDWLGNINDSLPSIQFTVNGEGHANIRLLCTPQGGLAVVTLDNPPNILDIIGGVVTGAENIVDLNQDLVSLPPETAQEIIFPVEVTGAGIHTIYIVYLPILDDSLIPVRFGGGFRGLELCGFLPEASMGIQGLRFVDCNLEQQNSDGSWSVVTGWEDWLDCVPTGGGGASGGAVSSRTVSVRLTGTLTNTLTTYATITSFAHTPQHTKMLVICANQYLSHSSSTGHAKCALFFDSNQGLDANQPGMRGTAAQQVEVSDRWENLTVGVSHNIELKFAREEAGTASAHSVSDLMFTIIEYDDAADLFVEDIRFVASTKELQKKIAGVWVTVTDSLAATLNAIQTTANNAAAAASAAAAAASAAQTTANGAVTVNNTQNTRLNNLEADVDDLQLSVAQHNLDIASLDSRLDAVEGLQTVLAFGGAWAWLHDFTVANGGYTAAAGTYSAGNGWVSSGGNINLTYGIEQIVENQITHAEIEVQINSGVSSLEWSVDNGVTWMLINGTAVGTYRGWARIPNSRAGDYFNFRVRYGAGTGITLKHIRFLGRGSNIPFD